MLFFTFRHYPRELRGVVAADAADFDLSPTLICILKFVSAGCSVAVAAAVVLDAAAMLLGGGVGRVR